MAQWNLKLVDGLVVVENLPGHNALAGYNNDGDVIAPRTLERTRDLHRLLYDLYQVDDTLKSGDEFLICGEVAYRCVGVHVEMVTD